MPSANAILPSSVRTTTTDGTITTGATIPTQTNHSYLVVAYVIVTDGSTTAGYIRSASFENSAGSLAQVGSTTSIATHEDIAAPMDVVFDTSGTEIRVRITGDPGRNLVWQIDLDVRQAAAIGS
jgi:hypothetical protein